MSRAVVDAKEFSHAMSKISKILKKCAIPILEEVCLRIQNGRCTLTATDLETWFTAELPASGDDMFFAFRKTKDILRACSHFAGELTMEFSETRSGSKKSEGFCSAVNAAVRNLRSTTERIIRIRRRLRRAMHFQ